MVFLCHKTTNALSAKDQIQELGHGTSTTITLVVQVTVRVVNVSVVFYVDSATMH